MRLIRFGNEDNEKPGIQLSDNQRIDVSAFGEDYDEHFFQTNGIERLRVWLETHQPSCPKVNETTRIAPPLTRPSKIICVGLNYAKHAQETGMDIPSEPVLFFKSTSAMVGANDDLVIPRGSEKTDWEVELAIVIGKKASYVSQDKSFDHIAGYVLHNDYSERAYQMERQGQWCKGKSCDTFAPIGPFIATKDEIPNPNHLDLWLKVNGQIKQQSNTSDFVFNTQQVVSYISQFMTLLPGDIISTGTPFGVGFSCTPPRYLQPGDIVELGIEGLGTSKQNVRAYRS